MIGQVRLRFDIELFLLFLPTRNAPIVTLESVFLRLQVTDTPPTDGFSPSMQHHTPHSTHPSVTLGPPGSATLPGASTPLGNASSGPGSNGPPGPGGPPGSSIPTPKLPPASYPPGSNPSQQQPPTPGSAVPPSSVLNSGSSAVGSGSTLPLPSSANGLPPPSSISLPPPPSSLPPQPSSAAQPPGSAGGGNGSGVPLSPGGSGDVTMTDSYSAGPSSGIDLSLDIHNVPPELKKEGSDWFAVFNPQGGKDGKKKALDVQLVHTLMHERYFFPHQKATRAAH